MFVEVTGRLGQLVRISDGIGELIDLLIAKYEAGEIEGLIICVKTKDGFEIGWTKTLSYLERLGLLEAAKGDCYYKALCPCGE